MSLGSQYLKVKGLFKLPQGVGVEPDPQKHFPVGWYDPAKRGQAAHKDAITNNKQKQKPNVSQ